MKRTKFEAPFQLSTRSLNHGAILNAAGFYVEPHKQAGSRRCVFYADDCPESRDLLEKYDRGEALPLSAKEILQSRSDLHHRALRAIQEVL